MCVTRHALPGQTAAPPSCPARAAAHARPSIHLSGVPAAGACVAMAANQLGLRVCVYLSYASALEPCGSCMRACIVLQLRAPCRGNTSSRPIAPTLTPCMRVSCLCSTLQPLTAVARCAEKRAPRARHSWPLLAAGWRLGRLAHCVLPGHGLAAPLRRHGRIHLGLLGGGQE